jgi:fumarylacetoacetate (FAA) hydrolase
MKLCTYRLANAVRTTAGTYASSFGFLQDGRIYDLPQGASAHLGSASLGEAAVGRSLLEFVRLARGARAVANELSALARSNKLPVGTLSYAEQDCMLLAPITRPPAMRDGYAFRQHVETARRNRGLEMIPEFDAFPVFYFTNHQAVVGPGALTVRKLHLDKLDFELEAAVVIGCEGRDLSVHDADKAIYGLTIMNDWSARTLQMEEMKLSLGPAKGKDFATGLGPYLVTIDELEPYLERTARGLVFHMPMKAWVNGVQVSSGNVDQMNWTFSQILERISYGVTIYPGEVLGSGTVGTGCFLELNGSKITQNQWLQPGDKVVLAIDGLGRLENHVELHEP